MVNGTRDERKFEAFMFGGSHPGQYMTVVNQEMSKSVKNCMYWPLSFNVNPSTFGQNRLNQNQQWNQQQNQQLMQHPQFQPFQPEQQPQQGNFERSGVNYSVGDFSQIPQGQNSPKSQGEVSSKGAGEFLDSQYPCNNPRNKNNRVFLMNPLIKAEMAKPNYQRGLEPGKMKMKQRPWRL